MRICKYCTDKFEPSSSGQQYCCKNCYAAAASERHKLWYAQKKAKENKSRICGICGNVFIPTTGQQRYCNEDCSKEATRRRNIKYVPVDRKKPQAEEPKPQKQNTSTASERWAKMSLKEISAECARYHLTYGRAQVMAENGTLPEDWGLHI